MHLVNHDLNYNQILFDSDSLSLYLDDDPAVTPSLENRLFDTMFGGVTFSKICRYTSLQTVFAMLNRLSFRMSGLAGMNDKTEVNYVDQYLEADETPYNKLHHKTISAINKRYITSCCKINMKDDLTLWRLYADDARGVCLVFDVKKENLGNYVFLHAVKYADKEGKHKELEFVNKVAQDVMTATGYKFEFRKLRYWKHFFKPSDYQVEAEVRLLIVDEGYLTKSRQLDWVLTNNHSIVNPIIDFELNHVDFPIRLREIILGSKCPEREINVKQLEELIRIKKRQINESQRSLNLNNLKVTESLIKNYR